MRCLLLFTAIALSAAACGSGEASEVPSSSVPPPSTATPAPSSAPSSAAPAAEVAIDPMALGGCRAPNEEGCASCCYFDADLGVCMARAAAGDGYGEAHALEGPCDEACRPCASCSRRDEQALRALADRADCACPEDDAPSSASACADAASCACWCARRAELRAACPAPAGSSRS